MNPYQILLALLLATLPLCAERITLDPSARNFEMHPKSKERIDVFDFEGAFPDLENIDINARRKKNVEFYLTGSYPILESLNYMGSFGSLTGDLTGNFPKLALINFLCASCAMDLDLRSDWQQSCEIHIRGGNENIVLTLPKDVGLIIYTKTDLKGKVIPCEELKKTKRFALLNKSFQNELAETASVVLTIHIEAKDGRIILQ